MIPRLQPNSQKTTTSCLSPNSFFLGLEKHHEVEVNAHSVKYVTYLPQRRGLRVRIARKAAGWLVYCKVRPGAVGHPGIFDILHFTYFTLGHAKTFSDVLNSALILKCRMSKGIGPVSSHIYTPVKQEVMVER